MKKRDFMDELNRIRRLAILGYGSVLLNYLAGAIFIYWYIGVIYRHGEKMLTWVILILVWFAGTIHLILGCILVAEANKKHKIIYKDLLVKRLLEDNFEKLTYEWKIGFQENTVQGYQLCETGNRFSSKDFVKAVWQRTPFEMSDVKITYNSTDNSNKMDFQGRILVFDIPEMHTGSIQIFSHSFLHKTINPKATQVAIPAADNMFTIFAVHPQIAPKFLTPEFMQGLKSLSVRFQSIAVHMYDTKVVVALAANESAFDAKRLFSKISPQEELDKINVEINDIKDIISTFYNSLSVPEQPNSIAHVTPDRAL